MQSWPAPCSARARTRTRGAPLHKPQGRVVVDVDAVLADDHRRRGVACAGGALVQAHERQLIVHLAAVHRLDAKPRVLVRELDDAARRAHACPALSTVEEEQRRRRRALGQAQLEGGVGLALRAPAGRERAGAGGERLQHARLQRRRRSRAVSVPRHALAAQRPHSARGAPVLHSRAADAGAGGEVVVGLDVQDLQRRCVAPSARRCGGQARSKARSSAQLPGHTVCSWMRPPSRGAAPHVLQVTAISKVDMPACEAARADSSSQRAGAAPWQAQRARCGHRPPQCMTAPPPTPVHAGPCATMQQLAPCPGSPWSSACP